MPDTRTLRLCVIQYTCPQEGPVVFSAGWQADPDDHKWQDDLRLVAAKKTSHTPDEFLTSIRYVDVEVPVLIGDLTLTGIADGEPGETP